MTQFSFTGVGVEFGGAPLLRDVSFTVTRGERWGIVGRNGSGKTTLLRMVTRAHQPTRGTVTAVSGLRVAVLDQHRDFEGAATVWEGAAGAFAELFQLERSLAEQADAMAAAGESVSQRMLDRYSRDLERFQREGGYELAPRIDAVLHGLGFDPDEARTKPISVLSGGERGRLALARQLVAPADLLILDEPTNHLDLETTAWLENYLRAADETVLLVSHDRALLDAVVDHVLHVEAGTAIPYGGGYSAFLRQHAERQLSQQRAFDKQRRVIEAEEDYIRRNIAGGNSAQAKGRRRRLSRVERLSPPPGSEGVMAVRFDNTERGPDQVLVAEDVEIAIGERTLLTRFSARVQRGEVVGLIGSNGAGKSTLLRTLLGERAAEGGEIRIPESVRIAHYRQDLAQVPMEKSLYDAIADRRPEWGRGPVQGHLGRFGFSGDSVLRKAGTLSGGERARLALALLMLEGANLMVFDEPTNHLDVESIEALEDALESFEGTVLLVSHDRALLRALVSRVWVLHTQRITDYPGTFEEWEAASAERAHAAAVEAAEEVALRRVHERKQVRGEAPRKERQAALRRAQRDLEAAEAAVATMESRLHEVRAALEDPTLYAKPDGADTAVRLGRELETIKTELDAALARWELASRAVESLTESVP